MPPLNRYFDSATLQRARSYVSKGHVKDIEKRPNGMLLGKVSNGRGMSYRQTIHIDDRRIEGYCSCPVGFNCKHVAAVVLQETARSDVARPTLSYDAQVWLQQTQHLKITTDTPATARSEDYPPRVKARLLFVLSPSQIDAKLDLYKGQINAAGTALNKSMRRHNARNVLTANDPPQFVRPIDLDLIGKLARLHMLLGFDGYFDLALTIGKPAPEEAREARTLLRRVAETGRMLWDNTPDAQLTWSDTRPEPHLAWQMNDTGTQKLGVSGADGKPLYLFNLRGDTLWLDRKTGQIGCLAQPLPVEMLRVVNNAPTLSPSEAQVARAQLPKTLGPLPVPAPRKIQQMTRDAKTRTAALTLGAGKAYQGYSRWQADISVLPTVALRFFYEGHEADREDSAVQVREDDTLITLKRDQEWETHCMERLMDAGALRLDELETYVPIHGMLDWDFAFAEGELNLHTLEETREDDALNFAFKTVPQLRAEGWTIRETSAWPYKLSKDNAELTVETGYTSGSAFQGNDWFSLGFKAEIGGKSVDAAPLIAAFLKQFRGDWDDIPDAEELAVILADDPVYIDQGKAGYSALDLSPLAPLLHLILTHHAELGALHPSEAGVARLVEEALAGSPIRFADNAGILPLARSLEALSQVAHFAPPDGLLATLRDYQAYGAAWLGSLIEAGFGAILADDMGLGKTLQVLTLLQARREAGIRGPALLIVPTSLIYSWKSQAEQFTPELRLTVLHGPGRANHRDAARESDLVLTTYSLLPRDKAWLSEQAWPLVILDEAQTLKNPAAQMTKALRDIPADGRIAMTGTPLENSLQDIWTLSDWVVPGLLGDRKNFQSVFRTPIEKHGDASAQARLNRRLRPFLLRRTKEEVAAELPPRTEIVERIELPKAQQALYETVRSAMDRRVQDAIAKRGLAASRITVLDALLKLRQVCCDPALVKMEVARQVTESAKRTRLREQLTELVAENRRVLVFSQFVEMLRLIEQDLEKAGIGSLSLTGETRDRAGVLEAFSRGDAPVFLLSLKAGGVGLTLTEADTVILYDPWWNPAVERQAMDRAHRIGQTKPVFVHRLVAAGTVEQKILDLQARKQALADALFDPEAKHADGLLDEATLRDLFAPLSH